MNPDNAPVPLESGPPAARHLPGPVAPVDPGQNAPEVGEYLRILVKRRAVILLTTMLVLVAAVAYALAAPRIYRATAKVQVLESPSILKPVAGPTVGTRPADMELMLRTQASIITSSLVAQETAARLAATQEVMVDPREIRKSLSVELQMPDLLTIAVEHIDPRRAALIANAVQQAYIKHDLKASRANAASVREFLEEQMPRLVQEVQTAEVRVLRYRAKHGLQGNRAQIGDLEARIVDEHIAAAERARADVDAARADTMALRRRISGRKPTRVVQRLVPDPELEGFGQEVAQVEVELAKARMRYDDTHPRVTALTERLDQMRTLMQKRYGDRRAPFRLERIEEPDPEYDALKVRVEDQEGQVLALTARANALTRIAQQKKAALPKTSDAQLEMQRLERAKEVAEKTYLGMLERLQQARIDEAGQRGTVREVDVADVPTRPVRPRVPTTLALAGFLGLFMGVTFALVLERTDTTIHDPDEMAWRTGIPVLGSVLAVRPSRYAERLPDPSVAEGLRLIHANLKFAFRGRPLRSLVITSVAPGEGKTFVGLHLAAVAAQSGARVVLVEADMRRPGIHPLLQWKGAPGLSDVLAGNTPLADALRATQVPGLRVLCSGRHTDNPTALLDSPTAAEVLEQLHDQADLVVFDTPPGLTIADTLLLSAKVDATVIVVAQGGVQSKAVIQLRRQIEHAHGTIAGAIINKVRPGIGDYYHHFYRYAYPGYGTGGEEGAEVRALSDHPEADGDADPPERQA